MEATALKKKLEREGLTIRRSYTGLLLKELGLNKILKRKFVVTADSNNAFPIAEKILNRNLSSL